MIDKVVVDSSQDDLRDMSAGTLVLNAHRWPRFGADCFLEQSSCLL